MFGFGEGQDQYNQVYNDDGQQQHEGHLSHEVVAGGASFAAFRAFENHQRNEGKTVNHAFAKELLAGFAGAEVDKLAETKGEDAFDREKAKHQAKRNAEQLYDQHYGNQDQYDPNQQGPPREIQQQFGGGFGGQGGGYGGQQGGGYGGDQGFGGNQGGYGGQQGGFDGGRQQGGW